MCPLLTMNLTQMWALIRRSGRVKDYLVSKAIDSEAKKPAKLVIMAKQ